VQEKVIQILICYFLGDDILTLYIHNKILMLVNAGEHFAVLVDACFVWFVDLLLELKR